MSTDFKLKTLNNLRAYITNVDSSDNAKQMSKAQKNFIRSVREVQPHQRHDNPSIYLPIYLSIYLSTGVRKWVIGF